MRARTQGAGVRRTWRGAALLVLLCLTMGCGAVVPGASADRSAGLALPNPDPCSYLTPEIAAEYLGPNPPRSDESSPSTCLYKRDTVLISFSVGSYDPRRQTEVEVLVASKAGRKEFVGDCPDVPETSLPPGMSANDFDKSLGIHCLLGIVTYVNDGRIVTLQGQFPGSRLVATMRQIIGR